LGPPTGCTRGSTPRAASVTPGQGTGARGAGARV
jgi:hypothetical protein